MKKLLIIFLLFCLRIEANPTPINTILILEANPTYRSWKKHLFFKESTCDYRCVHKIAIGGYGFLPSTLARLGYPITYEQFKSDPNVLPPELQERLLDALIYLNELTLSEVIKSNVGRNIQGIEVTREGILAASWLAGAGNVIRLFESGYVARDTINDVTVLDYLREFADYKIY
jgi:hypothetical protein